MKRLVAIMMLLALTLAGCGGRQSTVIETPAAPPETEASEPSEPRYLPETSPNREETPADEAEREARAAAELNARLYAQLDAMTREQKVGQLFFVRCPETSAADEIEKYHLGGVLLFARDFKDSAGNWLTADEVISKLASYQTAASYDTGIPLFIGCDEEGGTVVRASRDPYLFPSPAQSPQALYASGGFGAILNDAMQKSYLLHELGINVNFAPVCDVSVDPADFIYARSLGQDAQTTAAYVARVVQAMGDAGMGSVLKHFPGYGNNVDTHTGVAVDERPYETFVSSDFLPFLAGIRAESKRTPFVLVSHNIVTCMDGELPASLSPAVHGILRRELGFDGVILTDDLAMDALDAYTRDGSAAVLAIKAGNDMLVTTDYETEIAQVLAALDDGTLAEETVDLACLRVLRAKAQFFPNTYQEEPTP